MCMFVDTDTPDTCLSLQAKNKTKNKVIHGSPSVFECREKRYIYCKYYYYYYYMS